MLYISVLGQLLIILKLFVINSCIFLLLFFLHGIPRLLKAIIFNSIKIYLLILRIAFLYFIKNQNYFKQFSAFLLFKNSNRIIFSTSVHLEIYPRNYQPLFK